jgi:cysteine desulfurase family protein
VSTPIYVDNAATSWPKPPAVIAAMQQHYSEAGGNPGRSGHRMAVAAARIVARTREAVAEMLGASDPSRIVFTPNATYALNLALYGLLRQGDHVVTTRLEHNSVMRPLRDLEARGIHLTAVALDRRGDVDLEAMRAAMRPGTKLVVTTHASNVTGTLVPVGDVAAIARAVGALTLVDAAQTAGTMPIDVEGLGADLLAFTGHKGLLGPTGTGGLYVREHVDLRPLVRGGTGSDSAREHQPEFMPDAFESGTSNVAGLAGLGAAIDFLRAVGVAAVREHERTLVSRFLERAGDVPTLTAHGPHDAARQCGLVSFTLEALSPADVALLLDERFDVMVRAGLHCAPAAHRAIGTLPTGTVRASFGWFNTIADVDALLDALRSIAAWARTHGAELRT